LNPSKKGKLRECAFGGLVLNSQKKWVPSNLLALKLITTWQTTCSVCGRRRQSKRYMVTEGKLQDVQEAWLEVCAWHTQLVSWLW